MCRKRVIKTYRKYPEKGDIIKRTYRDRKVIIFKVLRNVDKLHPFFEEPVVKVKIIFISEPNIYTQGYFNRIYKIDNTLYEEIFYDKDYDMIYYECHDEKITMEQLMLELL